jgi:hypothetical protein
MNVQWQILLLVLWLLLLMIRRLCDRLLSATSYWLGTSFYVDSLGVGDEVGEEVLSAVGSSAVASKKKVRLKPLPSLSVALSHLENPDAEEHAWLEYFADPGLWWDNQSSKRNPKAPDFKHKVSKRALWIEGWFTPDWVRNKFRVE